MKAILTAAVVLAMFAAIEPVSAQFRSGSSGGSSAQADRFFGFLDRNRNGTIDGDELERMPAPIRDAMRSMRIDTRRGISRDQFTQMMPRLMEQMRAGRDRGMSSGGDRSRSSFDRSRSRGGDGGGNFSRDSRFSRSGGDPRFGSRNQKSRQPSRWKPKPRVRVTVDLPASYANHDKDGDGQIALYEWERAKYKEFYALDRNGDGILTPRELAAGSSNSGTTANTGRFSSVTVRRPSSSSSRPATGAVKILPVEFDKDSSEGRWVSFAFRSLDKNKDGLLTEDEWKQSRSTRQGFEKLGVTPPLPARYEQIAGLIVAVQRKLKEK